MIPRRPGVRPMSAVCLWARVSVGCDLAVEGVTSATRSSGSDGTQAGLRWDGREMPNDNARAGAQSMPVRDVQQSSARMPIMRSSQVTHGGSWYLEVVGT